MVEISSYYHLGAHDDWPLPDGDADGPFPHHLFDPDDEYYSDKAMKWRDGGQSSDNCPVKTSGENYSNPVFPIVTAW